MRAFLALLMLIGMSIALPQAAVATVRVEVNLSNQTMRVTSGRGESYTWPISTARAGYVTPRGVYSPQRLETMHYSRKYHMSPMPHSIFFRGGYAIHGTNEARALGRPASHGCIRLSKANAAKLFAMVKAEGATIAINGSAPRGTMIASSKKAGKTMLASQRGNSGRQLTGKIAPQPLGYAPMPTGPGNIKSWMKNPRDRSLY